MRGYPLELDVAGKDVVVVGGGAVAQRRAKALVDAGANVTVIAPELTSGLTSLPVTVRRRRYRAGDLAGAWLVHAATGDPAVNAAVAADAERERTWCVRADDAVASAARTPAVARHGDLTVAVTSGGDPRRSQRLRSAIALALADGSLPVRQRRRGTVSPSRPRPVGTSPVGTSPVMTGPVRTSPVGTSPVGTSPVMTGPVATDPVATDPVATDPVATDPVAAGPVVTGTVALVGGGPGDPGLITVSGRRLLAEADVVVADRLGPGALLDELDPDVEIVLAGKAPGAHTMTQDEINALIVGRALAGRRVVRLKGGDPFVFGRGGEEALACVRAGVPCTVVPGVTSAVAVPACAGIPVTHRGVSQDFAVVSAHLDPSQPGASADWESLATGPGTLVLLMAVAHLEAISAELIERGRAATTPVAVIRDGTLPGQQVLTSTLGRVAADAASQRVRPPAVVVIGDVVGLRDQLTARASRTTARGAA